MSLADLFMYFGSVDGTFLPRPHVCVHLSSEQKAKIQTADSIQLQHRHQFGISYEVDQPGGKKIGHKLVEMVVEFVASAVQFGNFVVAKPPVSVSEGGVGGQRRKEEAQGTELVFLSKPQSSSS